MTTDVRMYCADCGRKQMSFADIQKHPTKDEAYITVQKNISIPEPRNPENTVRQLTNEQVLQKPAKICIGCLADETETPTADFKWVGGKTK